MNRWTFLACSVIASLLVSTAVARAERPVRVAVAAFHGPGGTRARRAVREGLKAHHREVRLVAVAHADAVVTGTARHVGRSWIVQVEAHDPKSGRELASTTWRDHDAAHLARRIRMQVWPRLRKGLLEARASSRASAGAPAAGAAPPEAEAAPQGAGQGAPAEAATGEAVVAQKKEKPEQGGAAGKHPRPDTIRLAAGMQLFGRRFRFDGDTANAFGRYRLGAAPAVVVDGVWFPGAPFTRNAWAHLGVRVRYERAVALETAPSNNPGNVHYSTTADVVEAGVVGRLPLGRTELGLQVEYGRQRFVVSEPVSAFQQPVPDANYQYARFSGRFSYVIKTWLRLDVEAAYLWPFDPGPLSSSAWFPNASGNGFDVRSVVAFPFGLGFEGRVAFEYRWLRFDLSPGPSASRVASAAVDQTYGLGLELGWRY